jgi:hypothetical protein
MIARILNVSLVVIIIILLTKNCDTGYKLQDKNLKLQVLENQMVTYKDKNGNLESKVQVLQSFNVNAFTKLTLSEGIVKKLQEEVKKYKNNTVTSVVFQTNTVFDTTFQTDTMYSRITDTILHKEEIAYGFSFNDSWVKVNGTVDSKTTELSVEMTNEYGVTVKKKKGKYEAIVSNKNPYSTVKDMAAYSLSMPKPKRFGIGVSVGYGITSNLKPTPYIGVGLSYNLIRF